MNALIRISSVACLIGSAHAQTASSSEWIWSDKKAKKDEIAYFRTSFTLPAVPAKATLRFTCDNRTTVVLNGKTIGRTEDWNSPVVKSVEKELVAGNNWIAAQGENEGAGAAGLMVEIVAGDGKKLVGTDATWKWTSEAKGWNEATTDTSSWKSATSLAKYGDRPWGNVFDQPAAPKEETTEATTIKSLPGF